MKPPVSIEIRPFRPADLSRALAINNAAVPAVNRLDEAELAAQAVAARIAWVAVDADLVVGLLLAVGPGDRYASDNFQWFEARYDDHIYIDRIIVAESHRGAGIGERFYDDLAAFARPTFARLTCEVNTVPPNPGSLRFHKRLGFVEVGTNSYEDDGTKHVAMLMMPLS